MTDENIATPDSSDAEQPTQDYGTDAVSQDELSDGNHQPEEESVDYKERYVAQRKSAEQMLTEKKQVELENMQLKQQMMLNQQQQAFTPGFAHQQQQQQFQQQPPPQPAPPLEAFMDENERSAYLKAEEDLDLRAANRIRDVALSRRDAHVIQTAQQASMQTMSEAASSTLRQQTQVEFLKQNKDIFDDPATGQAILQDAIRIQSDPIQAGALELNMQNQQEMIPIQGQWINRKALNTAILAHRGFSSDAKKLGVQAARQTIGSNIGGTQRVSGEPGSGGSASFHPNTHLSSAERDAIQRFNKKSNALPNWRENGFKAYWNSLGKEMQKARLKEGRAVTQKEFDERFAR